MNLQTWPHRIALHLRSSYEWRKSPFGAASSDVQTRSIYGGIWARNWWTKGLQYSLDGFKGKSSPETIVLTIRYGGCWLKLSLKPIQWNIYIETCMFPRGKLQMCQAVACGSIPYLRPGWETINAPKLCRSMWRAKAADYVWRYTKTHTGWCPSVMWMLVYKLNTSSLYLP